MSILAFVLYYVCLSVGEKLADRGHAPAWIAMWTPNLLLGFAGGYLLHLSVRETRMIQIDRERVLGWLRRLRPAR